MKSKQKREGISYWASYSDMMAALLLVFSLIISLTMYRAKVDLEEQRAKAAQQEQEYQQAQVELENKTKELEKTKEELEDTSKQLEDIIGVRKEIIARLLEEFSKDGNIEIDKETGDIMLQSQILFDVNKSELNPTGTKFLDDFMPRYINVLMSDGIKDHISDIIIEGHTDPQDTYIYNLKLSQERARSVAVYCLANTNGVLTQDKIDYLESVLSTNGKSYSELKYKDKECTEIDYPASRRVEIKFRLSDEGQIDNIVKMMQEQLNK